MSIKIALAGNPNCGKTNMFNGLTGSNPVSYTHLPARKLTPSASNRARCSPAPPKPKEGERRPSP